MGFWLARERSVQATDTLTRFDARYWTINFPRPMMASVVTTAPDALRVDCVFQRSRDLAGLIWEAEDRHDHPLLRYDTDRDFRGCRLAFHWRSRGVQPLDAVHGPTLTIEGRDAAGAPRAWYVRLWNHASGTPEDASIVIDFDTLVGGFTLPAEADPVFAGDIDRMFVSIVPPGHVPDGPHLDAPVEAVVEMTGIQCTGPRCCLRIGDTVVPEHGLSIATGYDDHYHLTPARLLHNALRLGYRGAINHYVGMSHYFRLERAGDRFLVSLAGGVLNAACAAWHRDFAERAVASGYGVIWSLSYELFDAHCWDDWKQRTWDGREALTGWEPPSTLLSPAHGGAMHYLHQVARAFVAIGRASGMPVRFQVGEPWWWITPDHAPCLYDAAAVAAFGGEPVAITDIRGDKTVRETALLDQAGALLAASTAALGAAVRAEAPGAELLLLAYLPTVLDQAAPHAMRANLPTGWARPAFDVLQLEDYDWAAAGNAGATARGVALAEARLRYPAAEQHYLAGFVLRADQTEQWRGIDAAAATAQQRGVAATFVWALPQVLRDGYVHFDEEEPVQGFDDMRFPIAIGRAAEVMAETGSTILTSASGHEQRSVAWASARTRYDVGPGVRSAADIAELLAFFRARMGPVRAFRLSDPFDHRSCDGAGAVTPLDQAIGTGDGITMRFALVKRYGSVARRITRPVEGSVRIAVDGIETTRFAVEDGGWVTIDTPPPPGRPVTAGFGFDVPVRFAEDRLAVQAAGVLAGEAASVPLIEVRED